MRLSKKYILVILSTLLLQISYLKADEKIEAIVDQIQLISKDLKTLEKAVYNGPDISNITTLSSDGLNEDVLTKHLLKLNKIEDQFRELTNKFEEVHFKMDKLSTRVTKIQSDTQLRLTDIETGKPQNVKSNQINIVCRKAYFII